MPGADLALPSLPALTGAPVDLWDSGWPHGRFYWTVVPVIGHGGEHQVDDLDGWRRPGIGSRSPSPRSRGISKGSTLTIGAGDNAELALVDSVTGSVVTLSSPLTRSHGSGEKVAQGTQIEYRDAELPQDACANGRVMAFGKQSAPVVAGGSTAFASGLSPKGRLVASVEPQDVVLRSAARRLEARTRCRRLPGRMVEEGIPVEGRRLVATQSTSALLPLKAGRWFYRVRGVNALLPGSAKAMSWSTAQQLTLARPVFHRRSLELAEGDKVGAR